MLGGSSGVDACGSATREPRACPTPRTRIPSRGITRPTRGRMGGAGRSFTPGGMETGPSSASPLATDLGPAGHPIFGQPAESPSFAAVNRAAENASRTGSRGAAVSGPGAAPAAPATAPAARPGGGLRGSTRARGAPRRPRPRSLPAIGLRRLGGARRLFGRARARAARDAREVLAQRLRASAACTAPPRGGRSGTAAPPARPAPTPRATVQAGDPGGIAPRQLGGEVPQRADHESARSARPGGAGTPGSSRSRPAGDRGAGRAALQDVAHPHPRPGTVTPSRSRSRTARSTCCARSTAGSSRP